jgi:hypothetical protein
LFRHYQRCATFDRSRNKLVAVDVISGNTEKRLSGLDLARIIRDALDYQIWDLIYNQVRDLIGNAAAAYDTTTLFQENLVDRFTALAGHIAIP